MDIDGLLLARIQFAFTIAFHIIFPAFTIGLAAWITTLEGIWLKTGNDRYHLLARFWTKIFAVSFGMGVVSGIVLSYQFGTNWSRFSEVAGNIVGPLMGYEVLTAFFLEATFLGVMLFGWDKVPPWLHFAACGLVAFGTAMSAFWILSANSWMQYPTGHEVRDGIAYPVDWLEVVFNPTFPYRLAHMLTAAYLTTAFVVFSVGARFWLRGQHIRQAETMVKMALGLIIVLAPLQIFIGDQHGLATLEYQPAKLAAIEGHWGDEPAPVPLVLFAWPNEETESNDLAVQIPYLGSLILTHSWSGDFQGLRDFPEAERPPVAPVFFAFRIMVGIGFFMLLMAVTGGVLWWRGRLFRQGLYLKVAKHLWPIGFVAVLSGWIVTEVGRQPWVVTGVLRTAHAASPVAAGTVATSLAMFLLVYGVVFSAGIYYINRLLEKGPQPHREDTRGDSARRPISYAHDEGRVAIGSGR